MDDLGAGPSGGGIGRVATVVDTGGGWASTDLRSQSVLEEKRFELFKIKFESRGWRCGKGRAVAQGDVVLALLRSGYSKMI